MGPSIDLQCWMVVYSETMKIYENNYENKNQMDFYIDPGGPGGHPGGSRTHSGAEKHKKYHFFIFLHFFWTGTGMNRNRQEPNRPEPNRRLPVYIKSYEKNLGQTRAGPRPRPAQTRTQTCVNYWAWRAKRSEAKRIERSEAKRIERSESEGESK